METKYGLHIDEVEFSLYLKGLKNKIYKLLPLREEEMEWSKYLDTILIELSGLDDLLINKINLISLMAKLQGLYELEDFMAYRRTIFECLNLVEDLDRSKK